jgi:hypothetical protein
VQRISRLHKRGHGTLRTALRDDGLLKDGAAFPARASIKARKTPPLLDIASYQASILARPARSHRRLRRVPDTLEERGVPAPVQATLLNCDTAH